MTAASANFTRRLVASQKRRRRCGGFFGVAATSLRPADAALRCSRTFSPIRVIAVLQAAGRVAAYGLQMRGRDRRHSETSGMRPGALPMEFSRLIVPICLIGAVASAKIIFSALEAADGELGLLSSFRPISLAGFCPLAGAFFGFGMQAQHPRNGNRRKRAG